MLVILSTINIIILSMSFKKKNNPPEGGLYVMSVRDSRTTMKACNYYLKYPDQDHY